MRDRAFAYLAPAAQWLEFAVFLTGWTPDVVVLTDGRFEIAADVRERLTCAGVRIEERRVRGLVRTSDGAHLEAIELEDGARLARDVLFARPPQRQTELVRALELELDEHGFVRVSEMMETSRAGVYAAGDLTTMMQGALFGAAAGARAAATINHELTIASALP